MIQGDIYLANLNPTLGNEQAGVRPVVIISGNTMNKNFNVIIVCPLSSKVKNFESCVVISPTPENGLTTTSEAITFQIRTLSNQRLTQKLGKITGSQLKAILVGLTDILYY